MRIARLSLLIVLVGTLIAGLPAVASADVTGPCTGTYTVGSQVYDASATKITVDRDLISSTPGRYKGTISGVPSGDRTHQGGFVAGSSAFGSFNFGTWSGKTTQSTSSEGDGPSLKIFKSLPPLKIMVTGKHTDVGVVCSGKVLVVLGGEGNLDAVYKGVAVVGALIFLLLMLLGFRRKPGANKPLRAISGFVRGLLFAIFAIPALLFFCLANTESVLLPITLFGGAILGALIALYGSRAKKVMVEVPVAVAAAGTGADSGGTGEGSEDPEDTGDNDGTEDT